MRGIQSGKTEQPRLGSITLNCQEPSCSAVCPTDVPLLWRARCSWYSREMKIMTTNSQPYYGHDWSYSPIHVTEWRCQTYRAISPVWKVFSHQNTESTDLTCVYSPMPNRKKNSSVRYNRLVHGLDRKNNSDQSLSY